jgi:hypothetical protein
MSTQLEDVAGLAGQLVSIAGVLQRQVLLLANDQMPSSRPPRNRAECMARLRDLLETLRVMLEGITLNPDMMAVASDSWREIVQAQCDVADWIYFLDHLPEAAAAGLLKGGGPPCGCNGDA